jgi:glutamyl-tRNA synthetase
MKVRFAPSPTGLLHAGNARTAIANALLARRHGGHFLLRLDDTDRPRSRPEYEQAIQEDLAWLGVAWDEYARQTDRLDRYAAAAERLKAAGRLYPCFESEEELAYKREQRLRRHQPPIYDRAMLSLTAEQRARAEANGKRPYWRFKLLDGAASWDDLVLGPREVKLTATSDPVLLRADGTPLYTFTSSVDDLEDGVTHVIRGEDHVTNTGVQLDIMTALGVRRDAIQFGHLPLLLGDDGGKLSKRGGAPTLRGLRQDGIEPEALLGYLARLGSPDPPEPLSLDRLSVSFDLARLSHAPPRFDGTQLLALNRRALHAMPWEAVRDRLPAGATPTFWEAIRGNLDMLGEARGWWEVVTGTIVPPVVEGEEAYLRVALDLLPAEPWDETVWQGWTSALRDRTARKGRALILPLRLALTGEDHGPELRDLLPLIGRERTAERLRLAAS